MLTFTLNDPMVCFDETVELPEGAPSVTPTVYSLYYPETRSIVDHIWGKKPHGMYERNYLKRQNPMHETYLALWRKWSGLGLGDAFPHAYPTAGASEAIKDLIMNRLVTPHRVHMFDGDYEGYWQTAKASGVSWTKHDRAKPFAKLRSLKPGDAFWVSNPSAIDGEYWDAFDGWANEMYRRAPGVRIFLDVTYVGGVKHVQSLDPANYPNVAAVVFSLSKPMGVYYHRIGGVVSRTEFPSLWPNFWFKGLMSIRIGAALMSTFEVDALPKHYAPVQQQILSDLQARGAIPTTAHPSNVVLLARSTTGPEAHKRCEGHYRFCISPGMDQLIKGEWK